MKFVEETILFIYDSLHSSPKQIKDTNCNESFHFKDESQVRFLMRRHLSYSVVVKHVFNVSCYCPISSVGRAPAF